MTAKLNAGLPLGDYNALMEVVVNRRSVRELDHVDIPEAASGANTQPWNLVGIRGRQKIERLAETYVTERRQMIADHLEKSPQYSSRTELYTMQVEALPKAVDCWATVLGRALPVHVLDHIERGQAVMLSYIARAHLSGPRSGFRKVIPIEEANLIASYELEGHQAEESYRGPIADEDGQTEAVQAAARRLAPRLAKQLETRLRDFPRDSPE